MKHFLKFNSEVFMKSLFLFLFVTQAALAWGPQGHMIVGEIADHRLTDKARVETKKLLGTLTMAEAANWADHIKGQSQWSHTKPWHFVDIPDGMTYDQADHAHDGDAVTAITEQVSILKSSSSSLEAKQNALKFVIHIVGDLHQPLHAGRPSDRGGNSISVLFEGRKMNLHSLWDSSMIMKENMDYVAYARSLDQMSFLNSYDLPELSFSQIIREDMAARPEIYRFKAPAGNKPVTLGADYYERNLALMNNQLLMGGKRLADLLNKIYQ
jgi:hypothetical protein